MDVTYLINKFNNNNPYFSYQINDGRYEINFLIDNQLINHVAEDIINELIFDVKNLSMNDIKISQKYLNIYSQLTKLSESINCFDYADNTSIISSTVSYLNFLMNLLTEIIFSKSLNKYGHINNCLSCGIDLGHNNTRQYCHKTYCNKRVISIEIEDEKY